jgi:hypothetical protein
MKFKLEENFGRRTQHLFQIVGHDVRIDSSTKYAVLKGVVWSHWIRTFQMLRVFRRSGAAG